MKKIMRARRTPKVTRANSPTASKAGAKARHRLVDAIDRACRADYEVGWTNGYRAARRTADPAEQERLYRREESLSQLSCVARDRVDGLLRAYTRAVRSSR